MKQNKPYLTPFLKWPGGKSGELDIIRQAMPAFRNFYEPFVGGGAVYLSLEKDCRFFINDRSAELVELYRQIAQQNPGFLRDLDWLGRAWKELETLTESHVRDFRVMYDGFTGGGAEQRLKDGICEFVIRHHAGFARMFDSHFNVDIEHFLQEVNRNLYGKMRRMKAIEQERNALGEGDFADNVESALKSAFYMHMRHLYNHAARLALSPERFAAVYFFIRNYAYSGMFRYNADGRFNVPYGGIAYNRVNFSKKIDYLKDRLLVERLNATRIQNDDFGVFMRNHEPSAEDFVFLDPPYDSEFSTYEQNEFSRHDQTRLADYLLGDCKAKWMLVIKDTPLIRSLYEHRDVTMASFDKNYLVSFKNRNNKKTQHLMIMNY